MNTTLNAIRAHSPCADGWAKLLKHLGKTRADDEPLSVATILDSNGLNDALWCLRAVDGHDREIRLYAVWCARQVQHLMKDPRSLAALDVAERHAHGKATDAELSAARAAAGTAAGTAARAAAGTAARAASAVTWVAARAAARTAAGTAVRAASAAESAAAWTAAGTAAGTAARAAQEARLREICAGVAAITAEMGKGGA